MKPLLLILSVIVFTLSLEADDSTTVHKVAQTQTFYKQLSKLAMQKRLLSTAKEYEQYGSVERVALFDMAYPKDSTEYAAMQGFGILWVTSFSQIAQELPIKDLKIFLTGEKGFMKLDQVYSFVSVEQDPRIAKVLGGYRHDAVYLLPIAKELHNATLVTDFAMNRVDFKLGRVQTAFPPEIGTPLELDAIVKYPQKRAFFTMLEREYPIAKALIELQEKGTQAP